MRISIIASRMCAITKKFWRQRILKPEECMMIGNECVVEDLVAAELGIRVFLLTDCLIQQEAGGYLRVGAWRFSGALSDH